MRPVEMKKLMEKGTKPQRVTYQYYIGRFLMFEDNHDTAEKHLDYALQHCHKDYVRNKRRILEYLVPIKLRRGNLPTTQLLGKYGLNEFKKIVEGIRKGDLRSYQDGLDQFQDIFISRGTYLLLEKCKTLCYSNLFRRVHKIIGNHIVPLKDAVKAFKWLGMPVDLDEIECILANLIYDGHVRGYLSHEKRVIVLSKLNPFPSDVIVK